ncbi:hypothetical protein DSLPV1_009 [Dishui lake phycodnavirus 1]|uniref:hypothetical protein n=1 Tax=Dishui lake phycodnavirus 1 TaxID=2079134 RepID=UPI000CD6B324|nr:hypothetical protein C5Y57_gp009 [Dishui lake phycodnavirus 1]AUT18980.1 hypothetical protein DSLPV1_009 [Dishui lake phycodnavirus 1]
MPLSPFGYHDVKYKTELARHRALGRVVRAGEKPLTVFRALIRRSNYFIYSDPKLSRIFKRDAAWVKAKFM